MSQETAFHLQNHEPKKHNWLKPMRWSHDFRKSIAASKALMACGYESLGLLRSDQLDLNLATKEKPDLTSNGWDLYQDGDRVVCIYDNSVIVSQDPKETVFFADSIIRTAIRLYDNKLGGRA